MIHDVIIPARNETAGTLIPIIMAFRQCATVKRIILSDDGLDAGTVTAVYGLAAYHTLAPREGKGQAVKHGLQFVTAPRVVFCDGDLTGFRFRHARALTRHASGMTLGVTERSPGHPPWPVPDDVWPLVTGERSVPSELVRDLDLHGYCMEVQVNAAIMRAGVPVRMIPLRDVKGKSRWTDQREKERREGAEWLRLNGC